MRTNRVRLFEDTRIEEACELGGGATGSVFHDMLSVGGDVGYDGLVFNLDFAAGRIKAGVAASPQVVCSGVELTEAALIGWVADTCLLPSAFISILLFFQRLGKSYLAH
jgi:hypothetical protein